MKHNRILYGAPGTGKSFKLKKDVECDFSEANTERINFYNGYTYGQFIGSYKPKPIYKDDAGYNYDTSAYIRNASSEPFITYEYTPGIFLNILIKALKSSDTNHCLIIEEINRTKVDTVFGDMFQLLDRDNTGQSEYRVKCSEEMLNFIQTCELQSDIITEIKSNGIYIPENLYLWATMNSADQGVFPMDTAFKRRWNFEYIELDDNESEMADFKVKLTTDLTVTWNQFRQTVNKILSDDYDIAEDKLIAPFFIKKNDFDNDDVLDKSVFINKIVMYLKEDVLRHRSTEKIFSEKRFSDISKKYKNNDTIFCSDFLSQVQETSL